MNSSLIIHIQALGFCPDNGLGKTELWRVENFELAPVPPEKHGMFFGGDSYVLKYTYSDKGRENHIIYFWQVCIPFTRSIVSIVFPSIKKTQSCVKQ